MQASNKVTMDRFHHKTKGVHELQYRQSRGHHRASHLTERHKGDIEGGRVAEPTDYGETILVSRRVGDEETSQACKDAARLRKQAKGAFNTLYARQLRDQGGVDASLIFVKERNQPSIYEIMSSGVVSQ